ncbi:hypothetical protein R1flu_014769 [Riccia fluitans]|uniref:Reverse transcriptase Ty1/copia-type domain-containing protein n=1 Tax=Riccia fluitans TaxID=41844 RepID=A0ABD1YHF7_9MARC
MRKDMKSLNDNKNWKLVELPMGKQSPRQWNKRFDDFMKSQDFTRSAEDPHVYLKRVSNEVFGLVILVLYVNDMLIAAKDKSEVEKLKAQLSMEFSLKDLGPAKHILGMEIHRDVKGGKLWLTKKNYARDLDTRRSTMGYVMTLGGGCITWRFVLQKCKTLSTMEVEYVAMTEAAKEAIWLDRLTSETGLPQGFVTHYCDNKSALYLAANQVMNSKIKHIHVKYHFIKQVVSKGKVKLQKIVGALNPADGFTKYIPLESFSFHRAKLQILPMDEEES